MRTGQKKKELGRGASGVRSLDILPGALLAGAVAFAAACGERWLASAVNIPAMVIALVIGIALHGIARRPVFLTGITFCLKTLLRWAVALLGLRISLSEITALGLGTVLLTMMAMAITMLAGFLLARFLGQSEPYGALTGAATAVCGASATLATSAVLPPYKGKEADVAFMVIAVNALSTVAMVVYPLLCSLLGFSAMETGVLLGATIHDVAQVAGAGYAAGEAVGNTAVAVKLFRIMLLFPVVVCVAWWFMRPKPPIVALRSSVPGFALGFITLCLLNSATSVLAGGALIPLFASVKQAVHTLSTAGLLIAISALGLGTSFKAIALLGWRHILTVIGTTLTILVVVTGSLLAL